MPSRLSIIHNNAADSATLSVSPAENSSWPVANLKSTLRGEWLRTSGVSAQQVRATWAANVSIAAVALCHHNLTAAATWRVRLYSDAAYTTQVYDSGTVTAYDATEMSALDAIGDDSFREYKNSVLWFSATTARSMTIDLTDGSNADGYLQAARLFAGGYTELTRNFNWGHAITHVSPASQVSTLGGSTFGVWNGPMRRELQLSAENIATRSDRDFVFDLVRTKGHIGDFFLSAWPNAGGKITRDYQMWAALKDWGGIDRPMLNYYGWSATIVGK